MKAVLDTKTRFENEAQGNLKMAYSGAKLIHPIP